MMKRCRRVAAATFSKLVVLTALGLVLCGAGRVEPQKPETQLAFGVQMAKRGLWSEAMFRFQRAERADPGNPRILNNIAVAYEALGQFERALETYQRALKGAPSDAELKRNYSRFVEFYRNFRAETGEEEKGEGGDAAADAGGGL